MTVLMDNGVRVGVDIDSYAITLANHNSDKA